VDEAVWRGDGELGFRRSFGTSVLSIIVIGMGVSLGREAAPKLMGAAFGSVVGRWTGLSTAQLRLLVACGGGAGFAAVYNVPLGGALFTAEILLGSLCLGSGMSGGLFTPVLSTGAAFGGVLGAAWSLLWPGVPSGAYAMIGAAALIGAAMQAPLSALVLVLELTHVGFGLVLPMTVAVVTATAVARWVDGYSIYSARLSTLSP
jgi:H+/Cl- antiporter ClcA